MPTISIDSMKNLLRILVPTNNIFPVLVLGAPHPVLQPGAVDLLTFHAQLRPRVLQGHREDRRWLLHRHQVFLPQEPYLSIKTNTN